MWNKMFLMDVQWSPCLDSDVTKTLNLELYRIWKPMFLIRLVKTHQYHLMTRSNTQTQRSL